MDDSPEVIRRKSLPNVPEYVPVVNSPEMNIALTKLHAYKDLDISPFSLIFRHPPVESAYQEEQSFRRRKMIYYVFVYLYLYFLVWNVLEFVILRSILSILKLVAISTSLVVVAVFYSSNQTNIKIYSLIFTFNHVLFAIFSFDGFPSGVIHSSSFEFSLYSSGRNIFMLPFAGLVLFNVPFISLAAVQISFVVLSSIFFATSQRNVSWTQVSLFLASFVFENVIAIISCYIFSKDHRKYFAENLWYHFTENRALREESHVRQEILKQKGQYIAQVAHDIGTPLTTFTLTIELMKEYVHDEEQADILETAQVAIEHMTVTRLEALDHAKHMEGLTLRPNIKQVNIREIIHKCARIMTGYAGVCDIPHEFYMDPNMPKVLMTDYEWIWTMIVNYLSNAKKYSSKGRIITTVLVVPGKNMFRVEVDDEGIGVPDDRKNKLFRAFGQLQSGAGGTGLGLHGVSIKAQSLGGSVGVRDNPFAISGSSFWLEVPLTTFIESDRSASPQKLPNILLIGEWARFPSENKLMRFLKTKYEAITTLECIEHIHHIPIADRQQISAVLWLLEDSARLATKMELLGLFTMAKQQWSPTKMGSARPPEVLVVPPWTQQLWSASTPSKKKKNGYLNVIRPRWPNSRRQTAVITEDTYGVDTNRSKELFWRRSPSPGHASSSRKSGFFLPSPSENAKATHAFDFDADAVLSNSMTRIPAHQLRTAKNDTEDEMPDFDKTDFKNLFNQDFDFPSHEESSNYISESAGRSFSRSNLAQSSTPPRTPLSFTIDSYKIPSPVMSPSLRRHDQGLHLRYTSEVSDSKRSNNELSRERSSFSRLMNTSLGSQPPGVLEVAVLEAGKVVGFRIAHRLMSLESLIAFLIQTQAASDPSQAGINYFTLNNYGKKDKGDTNISSLLSTGGRGRVLTNTLASEPDILVVDDDPTVLKFLEKIFQRNGYSIQTEKNGFEGLNALKARPYKIAFIDRNMPVMDGLECIRRFRKWEGKKLEEGSAGRTRQYIAAFSANVHETDIKECLDTGADKFVSKPVTIDILLECIHIADQTKRGLTTQVSRLPHKRSAELDSSKSEEVHGRLPRPRVSSGYRGDRGEMARSPRQRTLSGGILLKKPPRRLKPIIDEAARNDSSLDNEVAVQDIPRLLSSESQPQLKAEATHQKMVLIVDDDFSILKFMKKMLEKHGFVVETCSNGAQALEQLQKNSNLYAAVIDLNMPVMGGKECVRRFRLWECDQIKNGYRRHKLGIVVLSGSDREETCNMDVNLVMSKPVQTEHLVQAVNNMYAQSPQLVQERTFVERKL